MCSVVAIYAKDLADIEMPESVTVNGRVLGPRESAHDCRPELKRRGVPWPLGRCALPSVRGILRSSKMIAGTGDGSSPDL
jgi:hypothetical protein